MQTIDWRSDSTRRRKLARQSARLLLADDHDVARAGLRRVLSRARGLDIVGEASNGREALNLVEVFKPDLLLVDVQMPDLDGLGVTRVVRQGSPATRVVIVTLDGAPHRLLKALKAGADAYVLKGCSPRLLLDVVYQTLDGQPLLQTELANYLWGNLQSGADGWRTNFSHPPSSLEREIVRLCGEGRTPAEIGRALKLEHSVLSNAMRQLLAKLGVSRG